MKTARVMPMTWELECPSCESLIVAPGGSHYWTDEDFIDKDVVHCHECGCDLKLPKAVRQ